MLDALKKFLGVSKPAPSQGKRVRASYDTAAKTPENLRHWQFTDELSSDESLNSTVRKELRQQARYECQENNSYGKGIAKTLVDDTVGTGPRLQMGFPNEVANRSIESLFSWWAQENDLANKIAVARMAKLVDGEAIIRLITRPNSDHPIQLGMQLIECDQLQAPTQREQEVTPTYVDGIWLDRNGDPISYDVLRYHPGARLDAYRPEEYDNYRADQIIHLFRADRPGQHRGISEFAPALPLFAMLRRFTLATISAAETAANVSQVIESDTPIPEELEEDYAVATFEKFHETIPIDRNSATVLPNSWKMRQFAPEHPTTTYSMFKQEILNEISRVVCMPRNAALLNSSDYNYASGRLDHLSYHNTIRIEQRYWDRKALDRIFASFLLEGALMGGIFPYEVSRSVLNVYSQFGLMGIAARTPHSWYWDGYEDADEEKQAKAQKIKLENGTTHREREYRDRGLDIEVEDERAAASFGMTVQEYRRSLAMKTFTNGNQTQSEEPAETPSEEDTGGSES